MLRQQDSVIADAIANEYERINQQLQLIASENIISPAVMQALSSVMSNKYAEGYPGKRYYAGCESMDVVENIAKVRAATLFGAEHANVQPHSGAQANAAVFLALLKPGDKILGMSLDAGGHLTHGHKVNFSGKIYEAHQYGVDQNGLLDYEKIAEQARLVKPKLIIAGASAYSRFINFFKFRQIADEVGAYLMVDMAHIAGLVAADVHPNPVPIADVVTSTTHKTLRGPRGGLILCRSDLANKIDKAVFPGTQGGPLMHVIAAKAVAFGEARDRSFRKYQADVLMNAKKMGEVFKLRGVQLVGGETENHLLLLSLANKNVTGAILEEALMECNIVTNKNSIPGDTKPPMETSGLRIGTPAATTRGLNQDDLNVVASTICDVIDDLHNTGEMRDIDLYKDRIELILREYPLYKYSLGPKGYL
jgi:glycine hydroxymethyltransferase